MIHEPVNQAAQSLEASALEMDSAGASDRDAETPHKLREALLKTFFTGFSWTAAARGLSSIGTALRYIVFVRLLKPFDFGVIAGAAAAGVLAILVALPIMGYLLRQTEYEAR